MKIPRCTKTITGSHYFIEDENNRIVIGKEFVGGYPRAICAKKCMFCGLIDDRKPTKGGTP